MRLKRIGTRIREGLASAYESVIAKTSHYKALKSELDEKDSKIRIIENNLVVKEGILEGLRNYLDDSNKELNNYKKEYKKQSEKSSALEKEFKETRRELGSEQLAKLVYQNEARRLAKQFLRSKFSGQELESLLSDEKESREQIIQRAIDSRDEELMKKYREDSNQAYELCANMNQGFLEQMKEMQTQLEYARGGLGFKEQQIRKWKSTGLAYFLRLFEKRTHLDEICGVYLDSEFKPAYATSKFLSTFHSTREDIKKGDIADLFSNIEDFPYEVIIKNARDRSESNFCMQVKLDDKEYKLELDYKYLTDREDKIVGAFIEFSEADLKLMYKVGNMWTKRKGHGVLEQIFKTKPNPNPA